MKLACDDGRSLRLERLARLQPRQWRETELHQTGSTLTPLDFEDFIPAAENPLSKASDGKVVGLDPGALSKAKSPP